LVNGSLQISSFMAPSKVGKKIATVDGRLKKCARIAPGLTRAVPVTIDITHKKHLGQEVFKLLKLAYLGRNIIKF
jgi:hypothetical protein